MGELIFFPHASIKLTDDELATYWRIRKNVKKVSSLEEIHRLQKEVTAFRAYLAKKYGR
ncbi:hypothetical protein [Thalassobacillus pellis]|uniref:hypothetical protein n=1 Tax=Thalassobacillus pellis TaxID=748008 RepID=UPI001961AF31|nr:hypothetical protein [Thalassobacillus pellis]MBM7553107.1 hypothetical protein [Thalassobacillus pellis]